MIRLGKFKKVLITFLLASVVNSSFAFPVLAAAPKGLSIAKVYPEQLNTEIWLSVWFDGYQGTSDGFKLVITQPHIQNSQFRREFSFENKWLSSGVRFKFLSLESMKSGPLQFSMEIFVSSGAKSNPSTFSFNYSEPTWQQAGCDDLSDLNSEWRSEERGIRPFDKEMADMEINSQNEFGKFHNLGCANKLSWKIVLVKVKKFIWQYTLCADGWRSSSTGSGTCSWHGGINSYRGYDKIVKARKIQFFWVY